LQTIPAAVIVVARAGHKSLLGELASERANELSVTLGEMRKKLKESEERLKSSELKLSTTEEKFRATEAELSATITRINYSEEKLKLSEDRVKETEQRAKIAEERFGALGDLVKYLFSENKRERIVAAHRQWPQLPGNAIAIITGSTQSYVSQVISEADLIGVGEEV
jgi:septal ring factor EnvC (AmiA/AmiB activator)